MPIRLVAVAALLCVCASIGRPARAQSLGDLAKKEEERRKTAPKADVAITNENLKADLRSAEPPASIATTRMQQVRPENRPRVGAAIGFFAYRFWYAQVFADYCGRRGFSVAPFVAAYRASQPAEYERAKSILGAEGITEDEVWAEAGPPMRQQAETLTPVQTQKLCGTFAQNSTELLSALKFSTLDPAKYKTLMATP